MLDTIHRSPYVVYMLHFPRPYAKGKQHYIGHSNNLPRRLKEHRRKGEEWQSFIVAKLVGRHTRSSAMYTELRWKRKGARRLCTHCRGSEPHTIGLVRPTRRNDPIGRFR